MTISLTQMNQLTLGVSLKDEATFENYFTGRNQLLIDQLRRTIEGTGERVIYFYSHGGEGRTHLLQAVCHAAAQQNQSAVYLPLEHMEDFTPSIFEGLESLSLICIDDIHQIAGQPAWEEAFFHLYNRLDAANCFLIVSANIQPKLLPMTLPDVISRLAWGMVFPLQPLSDDEKSEVLMARAKKRGMILSEEVVKFLLRHCPRHMTTLFAALDVIDKGSLALKRRLTVPFVKSLLQIT